MRLSRLLYAVSYVLCLLGCAGDPARPGDWPHYGGDAGSSRYSSLDLIDADNVARLRIAWVWSSIDNPLLEARSELRSLGFQVTPIAVDGVLYVSTSLSQVAAIDGASGETRWVFDPKSYEDGRPPNWGFVHRGVAYWRNGSKRRILHAAGNGRLHAIDALTGKSDPEFGEGGSVDLWRSLPRRSGPRQVGNSSPPVIWRDVVMVGSSIQDSARTQSAPPGQVSAYDVETGAWLWTFDLVPHPGTEGSETWEGGASAVAGAANAWAPMSVDLTSGLVCFGTGTPTNDFYGGHRLGDNHFAESVVCLRPEDGSLVWSFQITHHGLWDYDLPAAPMLVDVEIDDREVQALVQLTKQGFAFVFDRRTGVPVWPIEERSVPPSEVPGERASPTQPFPSRPPPFERQGLSESDLIDFTPSCARRRSSWWSATASDRSTRRRSRARPRPTRRSSRAARCSARCSCPARAAARTGVGERSIPRLAGSTCRRSRARSRLAWRLPTPRDRTSGTFAPASRESTDPMAFPSSLRPTVGSRRSTCGAASAFGRSRTAAARETTRDCGISSCRRSVRLAVPGRC